MFRMTDSELAQSISEEEVSGVAACWWSATSTARNTRKEEIQFKGEGESSAGIHPRSSKEAVKKGTVRYGPHRGHFECVVKCNQRTDLLDLSPTRTLCIRALGLCVAARATG